MSDFVTFFEWNCYKGNRPARVRRFLKRRLRKGKHDVVVLNEAAKFHEVIEQVAKELGYKFLREDTVPGFLTKDPRVEQGNTVMLVKIQDDLTIQRWRVAEMEEPWTVWQYNQAHKPRRQIVALLEGRGGLWLVAGQHWATKGNHKAQRESVEWTRGLLDQGNPFRDKKVIGSSVGDHNMSVADLRKEFPGFKVVGHSVDHVITEGSRVLHTMFGKGGGDHHAHEFVVYR